MTSKAQVRRLLALIPYLREHDGMPLTQAAAEFGVSPATLRADLGVLWMCGLPGLSPGDLIEIDMDAVDGEGVIHLSNADYLPRPLRLAADEALALIVALRTVRGIAGPGKWAAIDSALAKLESVAGNQVHSDQAAVLVQGGRDDIQALVTEGLQRRRRLDVTYDVASRAETTRRQVDPLRVFVLDGYGYLDGWCYLAGGLRTFRLDRIASASVTEIEVAEHEVELRDLAAGWFDNLSDAPIVRLAVDPPATWIAEYYPTEKVVALPTGGLEVAMRITHPRWLEGLLLRLGGRARVLAPSGAGAAAAAAASEAIAQYAALGLTE